MELWKGNMPYQHEGLEFKPELVEFEIDNPMALIVICPGGGYGALCEHEGEEYAKWLNKMGFSALVLKYRLTPYSGYAICSDAQRAMRIARKYADDRKIKYLGIMGSSAGGHLTGIASVHYDKLFYEHIDDVDNLCARPDFSVFCYPVIDMFEYTHQGTANIITNGSEDEKAKEFYSVNLHVNKNTPPAFIWHTSSDDAVPAENSILYANALSKYKIPYELHIFPYGVHGMGLSEQDEYIGQWKKLLINWLTKFIIR